MPLKFPIYMDFHASTPVDPRALEAMLPYFSVHFGNAASRTHAFGWKADDAVEAARRQVAALIGASAERDRLHQRRDRVEQPRDQRRRQRAAAQGQPHHHAWPPSTRPCSTAASSCRRDGFRRHVPRRAAPTAWSICSACAPRSPTRRSSSRVMAANNEIGVLQPVREIGRWRAIAACVLHSRRRAGAGQSPVRRRTRPPSTWRRITAHKMYGPKGVGALYVRKAEPQDRTRAAHRRRRPRARPARPAR